MKRRRLVLLAPPTAKTGLYLAASVVAHLVFAATVGGESDGSGPILFAETLVTGGLAMYFAVAGVDLATAVLLAAGPPAVFTGSRLYWGAGLASPGGSAQFLVAGWGWGDASAAAAVAAVLGAVAVAVWLFFAVTAALGADWKAVGRRLADED